MKYRNTMAFVLAFLLVGGLKGLAQDNTYHSVLSEHTWYRLSVNQEGAYQLDYATLQDMGIDMGTLNPNQIRLFGNPSGALPEKNSESRPDDLTEMAISVLGADDGHFDEGDLVLFYGQEPTRWKLLDNGNKTYQRERNYFSDTTYYYLCVDSGVDGLRVGEKPTLPVGNTTTVITDFPDYAWHETESFSPYSLGQNWWGELVSAENKELLIPFVFPNLVKSKALRVKAQVFGRTKNDKMYYDAWVNGNHVAINASIDKYKDHYYGWPSAFDKQIVLDNDTALFRLTCDADLKTFLYLDYVEIYGWRQLKRTNNNFLFRLMPSQFGADKSAVWVQDVSSECWLWDVSLPMRHKMQY